MGKGQTASAGLNWSRYSRSASLGFTEPYLFDKAILFGGEIYRRDYNSFNYIDGERETTYTQKSNGLGVRLGFPVTRILDVRNAIFAGLRTISRSSESTYYTDPDGTGPLDAECDPVKAGRYLCDEIGGRLTSSLGYTVAFDNSNGIRATRGQRLVLSQDFAGLGGDVKYLRTRADATKWIELPKRLHILGAARGRLHPSAAGFAQRRQRRDPDHRSLLRDAVARFRHPRDRSAHSANGV